MNLTTNQYRKLRDFIITKITTDNEYGEVIFGSYIKPLLKEDDWPSHVSRMVERDFCERIESRVGVKQYQSVILGEMVINKLKLKKNEEVF